MACVKYFLSLKKPKLDLQQAKSVIIRALEEDIGRGDITTEVCIHKKASIKAKIIAKENFRICGINLVKEVFKTVDPSLKVMLKAKEGRPAQTGNTLAIISGKASSILAAERVALNLLSLLSGIATKTSKFVDQIKPFGAKITDTRKTLPGLRLLQKYAVRVGAGYNHRMRLDEMILVKDNHLKIMGGHFKILEMPKGYKIEIEAQSLKEFIRALSLKPDIIMLDNMDIRDIQKAVRIRNNLKINCRTCRTLLEASGGINLGNVKQYASTGIDLISVGELTDSVDSVDISLEVL